MLKPQAEEQAQTGTSESRRQESDPILCPHCQRTATNGIKCQGICVADSDY